MARLLAICIAVDFGKDLFTQRILSDANPSIGSTTSGLRSPLATLLETLGFRSLSVANMNRDQSGPVLPSWVSHTKPRCWYRISGDDPDLGLPATPNKPLISKYAALEYAPNLDQFVYYSANDGAQIYSIAAPVGSSLTGGTWTWQELVNNDSLDPIADAQAISKHAVNRSHTFGRFRIATYGKIDLAILVRHIDTPVYAMRLS